MWTDTPLCELALRYHTDKCHFHNYTPYYHQLLSGKTVTRVLEIGLGWAGLMHAEYPNAGSLFMWRDYFPDAEIFGLDIRPDTLVNEGRIHSFEVDQSNEESLRSAASAVGGDFDLIVDDGSHVPEHQIMTAGVFLPRLAPDGIYVIEDVHNAYFPIGSGEHIHTPTGTMTELEYVRGALSRFAGFSHEVIETPSDVVPGDQLVVLRRI